MCKAKLYVPAGKTARHLGSNKEIFAVKQSFARSTNVVQSIGGYFEDNKTEESHLWRLFVGGMKI